MAEQTFILTISDIGGSEDRAGQLFTAVADLVLEMGYNESFVAMTTEVSGEAALNATEEALIRQRLSSASRSQVPNYPPELLQRLLDDARSLEDLLDWERASRGRRQRAPESATADDEATRESPLQELDYYDRLPMPERRAIVLQIAHKLATDPNFRWWVEDEVRKAHSDSADARIQQLRSMFDIGRDDDHIWVWIHGLKTFGEGETWGEARNDTLDEIGYALQELWEVDGKERPTG